MLEAVLDLEAKRDELKAELVRLSAQVKNKENTLRQVSNAVSDLWTRLKRMEKHGIL